MVSLSSPVLPLFPSETSTPSTSGGLSGRGTPSEDGSRCHPGDTPSEEASSPAYSSSLGSQRGERRGEAAGGVGGIGEVRRLVLILFA